MQLDKTIVAFFVLFLTVYFLESIGGFYMTTAVVSIEKQFQIPSKVSGTMVSAGDFGYIPSVVFVAYLGGKGNRARWIGCGCMLIALANLLISSSNFLFTDTVPEHFDHQMSTNEISVLEEADCSVVNASNYRDFPAYVVMQCLAEYKRVKPVIVSSSFAYCSAEINRDRIAQQQATCANDQLGHFGPTALIFGGLFILGIGRTMPFSLGLPLIDDNVKKRNLPIYFAVMFLIRMMGPVLGYSMGVFSNKYYYKFETPVGLTPVDPDWIGRWWMGFLVIGLVLFFPSLLLFLFPEPKPVEGKKGLSLVDRHIRKNSKGEAIVPKTAISKIKDFAETIGGVLKQPVYFGSMMGRILDVFAFKGFFVFLPKYLEVQFGLPQYKINMYMGVIGILGFAIGVSLGTVVMRVFKLEGRKAAGWVAICSALAAILSFANAGVGCESTLTVLGNDLAARTNLNQTCLTGCNCAGMPMFPVCDRKGGIFYSPCHAGCPLTLDQVDQFRDTGSQKTGIEFANCSCAGGDTVSRQFCDTEECESKALLYFVFMALGGMVGGMGVTPGVLILLRSVPPVHRSISLGFNGFLVSLFATLPSPIFWGWMFDKFCIMWDQKCPFAKGSCALYDASSLRVKMHVLYGCMRAFSLITDIFVVYHAKDLKLTEEENLEEEEESSEKPIRLDPVLSAEKPLMEPAIKTHKRTPSGGVQSKIAHRMDSEDEHQRKRSSLASEYLQNEISSPGGP